MSFCYVVNVPKMRSVRKSSHKYWFVLFNQFTIKTSMTRTPVIRVLWMIRTRFESLGISSDSSRKQICRDILGNFSCFIMKTYVVCIH